MVPWPRAGRRPRFQKKRKNNNGGCGWFLFIFRIRIVNIFRIKILVPHVLRAYYILHTIQYRLGTAQYRLGGRLPRGGRRGWGRRWCHGCAQAGRQAALFQKKETCNTVGFFRFRINIFRISPANNYLSLRTNTNKKSGSSRPRCIIPYLRCSTYYRPGTAQYRLGQPQKTLEPSEMVSGFGAFLRLVSPVCTAFVTRVC